MAGEIVGMAPERAAHVRAKCQVVAALKAAIAAKGLPCEAFVDGMAVEVDADTVYEPHARALRPCPMMP